MTRAREFKGIQGLYIATAEDPFAFGRASVFYQGTGENGEAVCIKEFHDPPVMEEDFFRELKSQGRLKHHNILPIIDYGRPTKRSPFIILPLCSFDLRRLLESRSFVPVSEAQPIVQQLAAAIDFSHSSGFIHGDIKPENILFGRDSNANHVYLADFGMATYFPLTEDMGDSTTRVSLRDLRGGTTGYLSPEQLDRLELSPYSDIYAFSMVVYELLTGRLPVDPMLPPYRRMKAKVEGDLIDPKAVNPLLNADLSAALLTGLSVNPDKRHRSAIAMCELLFGGIKESQDFFISYTAIDRKWAEWIAWELESAGFTTVLQEWDFRPGSNFVLAMNQAAAKAQRTIAVLSPEYLSGAFTHPEWAAAFARDPTGRSGTLVPIRVRRCDLDGILSQVVYIDLVEVGESDARERLLEGVSQKRKKPSARPLFPTGSNTHVPEFPRPDD